KKPRETGVFCFFSGQLRDRISYVRHDSLHRRRRFRALPGRLEPPRGRAGAGPVGARPCRGGSRAVKALRHALDGLAHLFRTQGNARIEAAAALLAVALGALLGLRDWEWLVLVLQIALVIALEAVNTAIEALCDEVTQERRPRIKAAKDVAAG